MCLRASGVVCFFGVLLALVYVSNAEVTVLNKWIANGNQRIVLNVTLAAPCDLDGWKFRLTFEKKFQKIFHWDLDYNNRKSRFIVMRNRPWNRQLHDGQVVTWEIKTEFLGTDVPSVRVKWLNPRCVAMPTPPSAPTTTPAPTTAAASGLLNTELVTSWKEQGGTMTEWRIRLRLPCDLSAWSVVLTFSAAPTRFTIWIAKHQQSCINTRQCVVENPDWYSAQKAGAWLFDQPFTYHAKFAAGVPSSVSAQWGPAVCGGAPGGTPQPAPTTSSTGPTSSSTPAPTTTASGGTSATPDYIDVLHKSNLFYEAQRSGRLPAENRVTWRKDSALSDGAPAGLDLTGGYYDAGDYIKFNFPMASAMTLLAWGLLEHRAGYVTAGELQYGRSTIKWGLDYFLKCHPSANVLYAQVGTGSVDHTYWGRPEDMPADRPVYKLTSTRPGSDLAGETAAAMAAGSLVFKDSDPTYSAELLRHARQLYTFATTYKMKYSDSIADADKYYRSYNGYEDELAWAAAWMYNATGEASYLQEAKDSIENQEHSTELSWDDKVVGASLLVFAADDTHAASKSKIKHFYDYWLGYGDYKVYMTPKGLAWHSKWGSLRYTANAVFALQVTSGLASSLGLTAAERGDIRDFVKTQVGYMLGEAVSGRSYVVGYGRSPPTHPHHAASSCPDALVQPVCDWGDFEADGPNPHTLFGALVGGPDANDRYVDDRKDYIMNEVTLDYNAGFQSAVAGLIQTP